jgi:stage II sporulation protein D
MKKILIKTALVSVVVLIFPLILTLLLTNKGGNNTSMDFMDFEIYYEPNGTEEELEFNQYLMGIVAANMPAGYDMEALKAQAVIARTYSLYNIAMLSKETPDKKKFATSELGLSFISMDSLEEYWGSEEYIDYFTKIENAVSATEDEVLIYDDELILPVFFYTGSGYTRNASEAWGIDVPYLTSVSSKQDVTSTDYLKITEFSIGDLLSLLNHHYSNLSISEDSFFEDVKVVKRDSIDYVIKMNLGDQTVSGEEFAKVLGLNSSHFYIEDYEGKVRIICNGVGHGVGLSQYGANAMAGEGYPYREILVHYYTDAEIADSKGSD